MRLIGGAQATARDAIGTLSFNGRKVARTTLSAANTNYSVTAATVAFNGTGRSIFESLVMHVVLSRSKTTCNNEKLHFATVYNLRIGSVAERLKAPVLKTGDGATRS